MNFLDFLNEDRMFSVAQKAMKSLSDKAATAIGEWSTRNWIGGKLEKHYLAKDSVYEEIQSTFDKYFADFIPDEVTLYRGINPHLLQHKSVKELVDSKVLESWTDDIRVAEWFASMRATPKLTHDEIQKEKMKKYDNIDEIGKRFYRNGYVIFDNNLYVINKENGKYYDAWSLDKSKANRWLFDGYTSNFLDDIKSRKQDDIDIYNDATKRMGKVITKTFKRSDILWYIKNPWNSSIEYIIKVK